MTAYIKSRRENWPRSSDPRLDWARTDDGRVLVTLRRKGGGWFDARPVTVTGVEARVLVAETPAYMALVVLSGQPQFFSGGLEPADAITRDLLRADARRHKHARDAIERACAGEIAWLDEEEAALAAEE